MMRPFNRLKKACGSVLVRLFLVILMAGICINLLVGVFFGHAFKHRAEDAVRRTVSHYIRYIIVDMGHPPDAVRAERIAAESSLEIRFQGSDGNGWLTRGATADVAGVNWKQIEGSPGVKIGRDHRRYFVSVAVPAGTLVFELGQLEMHDERIKIFAVLVVCGLSLILIVAYLIIRRIMRPMAHVKRGVQEFGNGNLEHRVPSAGAREFRELAAAFNDMAYRIGKMIAEKEQLLLDVSHELRSPITRMKVALEFLTDDKKRNSLADDIAEMEQMVTEILESARLRNADGNLKKEDVELVSLVIEATAAFQRPPGVDTSRLSGKVVIHADPGLVKSVIRNIITNALKYSSPDAKPIVLTVAREKSNIVLTIQDDGPGIPTEDMPHIFEPFYRVDKSRSRETGGYGLGLSLCKTIMEAHDGSIEITSIHGEGTCVRLLFAV